MADHLRPDGTGLSQAAGANPSGLYILTVRHGVRATGMLASWVQQAEISRPPMLTVAVKRRERFVGDWITTSGRFTLNQLATGGKALIRTLRSRVRGSRPMHSRG